jgi:hypothetical protein
VDQEKAVVMILEIESTSSYYIITPEDIGRYRSPSVVIGLVSHERLGFLKPGYFALCIKFDRSQVITFVFQFL